MRARVRTEYTLDVCTYSRSYIILLFFSLLFSGNADVTLEALRILRVISPLESLFHADFTPIFWPEFQKIFAEPITSRRCSELVRDELKTAA